MKLTPLHGSRVGVSLLSAAILFIGASVHAQSTVTVGTSAPAAGDGVESLFGSSGGNVNLQFIPSDYIAGDNIASLGQTFTTGSNALGYQLNSLSFMQVADTQTFWSGNGALGFRVFQVTAPAPSGAAGITVLEQESNLAFPVATTGLQSGIPGSEAWWVTVTLDTPLVLAPSTLYGFDIQTDGTGGNLRYFMEWNGIGLDVYDGGQAIGGGTATTPDPIAVWQGEGAISGDRVFVANMTAIPEPSTTAIFAVGAMAIAMRRRRRA